MIAPSAVPFSVRNVLDRVFQCATSPRLHHYARLLFSGGGLSLRQRVFSAYGDWSSVLDLPCRGATSSRDRTERLRRF